MGGGADKPQSRHFGACAVLIYVTLLLTLIVTLFDRFEEIHLARFPRLNV